MSQNQFLSGARILSEEEANDTDLGCLSQLAGTWCSVKVPDEKIASGWNAISVPGKFGFDFEIIPYTEVLTFQPVVVALNKGPFVRDNEVVQEVTGLMYSQHIKSASPDDKNYNKQFPNGSQIHAETGFFLNFQQKNNPNNPSDGFAFARLATIPHGNSVLALGTTFSLQNPGNDFFMKQPKLQDGQYPAYPTNLDGSPVAAGGGVGFDYNVNINKQIFPGVIDQRDPNSFLKSTLGNSVITDMVTLKMSTNNANAGGGILNIPFVESNARATTMDAIFWIETIKGQDQLQLQYTQTINLVFPSTGSARPIVWPHITVSTLVKDK